MIRTVGIYKITSPSGKVYIGQSTDLLRRMASYSWKFYDDHKSLIHNSIRKYGIENHVIGIVHELPIDVEQSVLNEYEKLYIDLYKSCGCIMLNIKEGGANGKHSQETINKLKARVVTDEIKAKMSKGIKASMTPEHKQRLSNIHKGSKRSESHKRSISISWAKRKSA